jgi:hypothetical protein
MVSEWKVKKFEEEEANLGKSFVVDQQAFVSIISYNRDLTALGTEKLGDVWVLAQLYRKLQMLLGNERIHIPF